MDNPPPITAPALLHEIRTVGDFLVAAHDMISQGHMPDMTPLEKRMEVLCVTLQEAPDDVQDACIDEFSGLLAKLDDVGTSMKAWHDKKTA